MTHRLFPFSATLRPSGKGSLRLIGNFPFSWILQSLLCFMSEALLILAQSHWSDREFRLFCELWFFGSIVCEKDLKMNHCTTLQGHVQVPIFYSPFLEGGCYLFMTNIPHAWSSLVGSSLKWCHWPWPVRGFKLAVEAACHLVSLSHVHLEGRVVLGADDAVARGVFPQHVQAHELACVLLHVEGAPATTSMIMGPKKPLFTFENLGFFLGICWNVNLFSFSSWRVKGRKILKIFRLLGSATNKNGSFSPLFFQGKLVLWG